MQLEHHLSVLLLIHLHSLLNTWLQWIGQRQLQDMTRKFKFGIGVLHKRFDGIYLKLLGLWAHKTFMKWVTWNQAESQAHGQSCSINIGPTRVSHVGRRFLPFCTLTLSEGTLQLHLIRLHLHNSQGFSQTRVHAFLSHKTVSEIPFYDSKGSKDPSLLEESVSLQYDGAQI